MRPSHRSASYQFHAPTLEVRESELISPFVVGGWQCHTALGANLPTNFQPADSIKGLATNKSGRESCSESRKVRTVDRPLHILQEVGHIHNANIQRSLTHRIQMAKQRGDQQLLDALASEFRAIAPF
ncbi:hypothetical protein ACKFKF_24900 [Phormidesmis sp. 146-12]